MKKIVPLIAVGCLLLNGCGSPPSSDRAQETTSPPPANVPPPIPPQNTPESPAPTAIANSGAGISSLIPSTDPDQRRQSIQSGRTDPFAVIPVMPTIKVKKVAKPPDKQAKPSKVVSESNIAPTPSPEVPAIPEPNEARGVLVSGVIRTAQSPIAIVKAPSESVARQVMPGTMLANGLVQVKSIDTSSEVPEVVLEQYGIEVVRTVGQEPEMPPSPSK